MVSACAHATAALRPNSAKRFAVRTLGLVARHVVAFVRLFGASSFGATMPGFIGLYESRQTGVERRPGLAKPDGALCFNSFVLQIKFSNRRNVFPHGVARQGSV